MAIYDLANAYFMNEQYIRCINLIEKHQPSITKYPCSASFPQTEKFKILQAQAYLHSKNIDKCIETFEKSKNIENEGLSSFEMSVFEEEQSNYYKGLKHLILAKAYEHQENNECSCLNYKLALQHNPENYEAFERLITNHLLTQEEKRSFLSTLSFTEDNLWLKDYYLSRVLVRIIDEPQGTVLVNIQDPLINSPNPKGSTTKEFIGHSLTNFVENTPEHSRSKPSKTPEILRKNLENSDREVGVLTVLYNGGNSYVKVIEAESYYNGQNVTKAYEIVKGIIDEDIYFLNAIPLYAAILIELNQVGDLYILAHKLVSANPGLAISWFAVG